MMRQRSLQYLAVGMCLLLVAFVVWRLYSPPEPEVVSSEDSVLSPELVEESPSPPLPGDEILEGYGEVSTTARDDLRLVRHAVDNFRLLNKHIDARFYSANEDIAELFLGKRGASHPFVSEGAAVLDETGRLIDRWQTPLHFHLQSEGVLDIRSAGPDRELFTEDDVVDEAM